MVTTNPLLQVKQLGQSIWLDSIRRSQITSGGLKRLIDEDGISGETSNPSIFEKAIAGSDDYADEIHALIARGKNALEIYETLAIQDVQMACDAFRPVYTATRGTDGFVSIEVSPHLAHDTAGTIAEAKRLFRAVSRPNVMIKIPGTPEGVPAIEECLAAGVNVNVTLLFAIPAYEQIAWAYVRALDRRAAEGKPIDRLASVASFFVSRIDTLADRLLDDKIKTTADPVRQAQLAALRGQAAIASAKIAYQSFKQIFGSARFLALHARGARVQRPLWASTSTKNPQYPDTLYVDTLIGANTVNTLPMETIEAFRDHGVARVTIEENLDAARRALEELERAGISMQAVTQQLLDEGVVKFAQAFDQLLASIENQIVAAARARQSASLGDYLDAVTRNIAAAEQNQIAARVWNKDATLWKTEPAHVVAEISNRLGWLTVMREMRGKVAELTAFAREIKQAGFQSVVLCGMGGSSLSVEVLRDVIGIARGYPRLFVLDTTAPATIRALERKLNPKKTLFVIASKSGGTVETLSHYKYFAARAPAQNFVVITDPDSALDKLAAQNQLRVFRNPSDIGGRYSALSYFGLVPAALMGIDLDRLLDRAEAMARACAADVPAETNPGEWLGVTLATLADQGRDKLTFVAARGVAAFGAWAEQLIAESIGKENQKGIVPVDGEPLARPRAYGNDRLFVHLQLGDKKEARVERALNALEKTGHPILRLHWRDAYDLGAEFFRWEFATAIAGALFGVNPFDQPDVDEAKANAQKFLTTDGRLPTDAKPIFENKAFAVYATEKITAKNLRDALRAFFALAQPGDYLALMAYLPPTPARRAALESLRVAARDARQIATTVGFGPRFLHSTGQLHKGGANRVLALQITADSPTEAKIPGEAYTFGALLRAQAAGDWQALARRGRRVWRVHLKRGSTLSELVAVAVRAAKSGT